MDFQRHLNISILHLKAKGKELNSNIITANDVYLGLLYGMVRIVTSCVMLKDGVIYIYTYMNIKQA